MVTNCSGRDERNPSALYGGGILLPLGLCRATTEGGFIAWLLSCRAGGFSSSVLFFWFSFWVRMDTKVMMNEEMAGGESPG